MPFIEYQEMNFTAARMEKIETANAISSLIRDEEAWKATQAEERERREILSTLHDRFDDIKSAIERGEL